MDIPRHALQLLKRWKNSTDRKPVVLQGARQVGKTWLLKHFGEREFQNVAYFNFERQTELKQFFETTKDPEQIIENLTLVHGSAILPQFTLIIFDEIQECNDALNSLKYFCEDAPGYVIACAGSLLGVAMSRGASFPVGKVDFITVYPVSFSEFLAVADQNLFRYTESIDKFKPVPDIFFNPLKDKLKMFYISGGMPEAIVALLDKRDLQTTQDVLQNILNAYSLDFSKHVDPKDIPKIQYIWASIPSQLARENKKFLYRTVKTGARAREYEDALQWLVNAGLTYRIFCSSKPSLPLSSYDDVSAFKVYMPDVGLLRRLSLLDPIAVSEGNRLFTEFRGAMTENYILESLVNQFEGLPRYWRSGNMAEVDFLVQYKNRVIPMEVKSDENVRSKSLSFYRKAYNPKLAVRYSLKNLSLEDGLISIPLFLADHTARFIDMALSKS